MPHDPLEKPEIADLLASLVDRSLVVLDHDTGRYRLLESVRQFARDRWMEQQEPHPLRDRHLTCFRALAEEAEPHLAAGEQQAWLERLDRERGNLRAALRWAEGSNPDEGLRLAGAAWRFWYVRGHFAEGRERFAALLAEPGRDPAARAAALTGAGVLDWCQGDYAASRAHFEEALAIRRDLGDRPGIAALLNNLGNVAYDQGDYPAARALFEESLALRRELGEQRGIGATLNNLGNVLNELGDYDDARALYEESLALKREIGDRWGMAHALTNLGNVSYNQGDYAAADARVEESLEIRRELGDLSGIALSLNNRGNVALALGDHARAHSLFRESLAIKRDIGDRFGISFSLEGVAAAEAGLGRWTPAARLWGAAERLREEIGAPIPLSDRPSYEQSVAAARAADPSAFEAAWREGQAMTLPQAITFAMELTA